MWIESHIDLANHPKLARLARELGVSDVAAVGHLHLLWWWCAKYADDGDLSKWSPVDIASGAHWEGDADDFMSALLASRFVDADSQVHDWSNYYKLRRRRELSAERMARWRVAHKAPPTEDQLRAAEEAKKRIADALKKPGGVVKGLK